MSDTDYTRLQDIGKGAYASIAQMVAALDEAESSGNDALETAQQQILDDALSVRVRSGWVDAVTDFEAEEFEILLATGGPAVRIVGELDRGEPSRARLEVQDWGTPWTQYFPADSDTLLKYAGCFYFGS